MLYKKLLSFSLLSVIIFLGLFLSNVSKAQAATLYFNVPENADTNWNNSENWCLDSSSPCTAPAGSIPTSSDDVIVSSLLDTNNGANPVVNTLTVNSGTNFYISITVLNGATFENSSWYAGTLNGSAVFNDNSTIADVSTITGNVTFNGSSFDDGAATINGNLILNTDYYTGSVPFGSELVMTDGISWISNVLGKVYDSIGTTEITKIIFNGSGGNYGTIRGNPIFNNSSYNDVSGIINGNPTFNTSGVNYGQITGDPIFNDSSNVDVTGTINGNPTFNTLSVNYGQITGDPIFNDSSFNAYSITGDSTFNGSSYNQATISGNAIFNGNLSEDNNYGGISGNKTRIYKSNMYINRDFITTGPWTVVADNAVVNISHSNIDTDPLSLTYTTLSPIHGGSFDLGAPHVIVNSLLDDGDGTCTEVKCTFRDAINTSGGGDIIEFGDLTGSIMLSKDEQIDLGHGLTIQGPGSNILTIDFNVSSMTYISHTNGNLDISGLTIANGSNPIHENSSDLLSISNTKFINNINNAPLYIATSGGTTLNNVDFINNGAGAIYDSSGDLTINNSTFSNNSNMGDNGGAINYTGSGILNIINSTFSNNTAFSYGSIQVYSATNINITNSTFSTPSLDQDYALYIDIGTASNITNSIFYSTKDNNCAPTGIYTSGGHNIESGSTCGFNQTGDLMNPTNYSILHNFEAADGGYPYGDLVEAADGNLYGLTSNDNDGGVPVIFKYNPTSKIYTKLYDLGGEKGNYPYGSLIISNGVFYGMTYSGGAYDFGTIFSYDQSDVGNEYHILHDFGNGDDGYDPNGSLIVSNGVFYGMTTGGGANGYGTVFSYNPAAQVGSEYTILHDFNGDGIDGYNSSGSLIVSNGIFYGMTSLGGANNVGIIFSYNPAAQVGSEYTILHDFNGDGIDGYSPNGSLIVSNGIFYGMTSSGGANSIGIIFSYNPNANLGQEYTVLYDFVDGHNYSSSLIVSNGVFYGMTNSGGANNYGTVFFYDPTALIGHRYTKLHDFNLNNIDGINPYGSLIISNGVLYGMTSAGGINIAGTIFAYNLNLTPLFDPLTILDPAGLKDNGGPVKTIALLSGSPAINAGTSGEGIPTTDARGLSRVGTTDMGAFEYQGSSTPPTPTCSDGIQNQNETGIDTGGVCTPPTETCSDGIQNQNETGIDTGGVCAPVVPPTPTSHSGGYSSNSSSSSVLPVTPPLKPILKTNDTCKKGDLFDSNTGKRCTDITPTTTPTVSPSPISPNITRVLKLGMTGDDVKALQVYLNTHGYIVSKIGAGSPDHESTYFGPATKKALMKFQKDHNLKPDGVLGQKSREVMK